MSPPRQTSSSSRVAPIRSSRAMIRSTRAALMARTSEATASNALSGSGVGSVNVAMSVTCLIGRAVIFEPELFLDDMEVGDHTSRGGIGLRGC